MQLSKMQSVDPLKCVFLALREAMCNVLLAESLALLLAMADTSGFVYIIVLIEKSARKIHNTSQTENLRVFFSTKCVIKDTIWFSKTKISERIEIEK